MYYIVFAITAKVFVCFFGQLKARIEENNADVLVLRIPVEDRDEVKTINWNAKFVVIQGNENNNFRVDTDPKTNEGLLYVIKVSQDSPFT